MAGGIKFSDNESIRAQRNATLNQKKHHNNVKEGVIVKSFIKEGSYYNLDNVQTNFLIPEKTSLPNDLFEKEQKKEGKVNKTFLNLSIAALSVLALGAIATKVGARIASKKLKPPSWKEFSDITKESLSYATKNSSKRVDENLPKVPRNMNILDEHHFVTYVAIQNPTLKNTLGALSVFAFSSMAFTLKSFVDGAKEVFVVKKDADIQKDLQENLIDVETKLFKGKTDIIRNMLNKNSKKFSEIINNADKKEKNQANFFRGISQKYKYKLSFNGEKKDADKKSNHLLNNILLSGATLAGAILLGRSMNKNVKQIGKTFSKFNDEMHKSVENVIKNASEETLITNQEMVKELLTTLNFKSDFAKETLTKAKVDKDETQKIVEFIKNKEKVFAIPPSALGGKPGEQTAFYTYLEGTKSHFYNFIMNPGSKPLKNLFIALASVSGIGYVGERAVEAIKEVQVKKENAKVELDLQKRLVSTELRNFKAKKESVINPLIKEFDNEVKKDEQASQLKAMANNILFEIKNGAPFVYS